MDIIARRVHFGRVQTEEIYPCTFDQRGQLANAILDSVLINAWIVIDKDEGGTHKIDPGT